MVGKKVRIVLAGDKGGNIMDNHVSWKIDDNEELPLAIIEDTEDGFGVAEIGVRT